MTKTPPQDKPESLDHLALELARKKYGLEDAFVVESLQGVLRTTKQTVNQFRVASFSNANGPHHVMVLDEHGREVKLDKSRKGDDVDFPSATVPLEPGASGAKPAAAISIDPAENHLVLNKGDTLDETITVTIPPKATVPRADIYFLADTTGSMGGTLAAVQADANNLLATLNGLGLDLMYGVGNYKDFPSDPFAFEHQLNPSNAVASVTAAINTWAASGGGDTPEGQFFALDQLAEPAGGAIGWRASAKRIVVWFGDAPAHDPVCAAISGLPADITEASLTAKLVAEKIAVLAISVTNPGLDGDPVPISMDYNAACGSPAGTAGQATRIANATGGQFATGSSATVVNTIINLVKAAVSQINNVSLVATGATAPFVSSISPAGGYGPLAGDKEHKLEFKVKFTGIAPCAEKEQIFNGTLDVVADGAVVAQKPVEIKVPPCAANYSYSVKFVCGTQAECDCECTPVQPGRYSTEINIHNYSLKEVEVQKRFIPVVLAGAPAGREPLVAKVRAEDKILLPAQTATMDDCCRIAALLFGGEPSSPMPLTIGILEITANADLAVTAVYTTSSLKAGSGISIAVEQIKAARLK